MGIATFAKQPTSVDGCAALGRAIRAAGATPKHIICDRGAQFDCRDFRRWRQRRGVKPRYGAIGKHGGIAVVGRFILTLKGLLAQLAIVPLRREKLRQELRAIRDWYNQHRPHETLGGRTPDEVYFKRFPANRRPRWEPRQRWPRAPPCAKPWALIRGRPGARLTLDVTYYQGRRHLPVVSLRRAA